MKPTTTYQDRELSAPLAVDASVGNRWIKGQQISTWDLPEFCREAFSGPVRVTASISEITQTLDDCDDGTIRLQHPAMPDAVKIWNSESRRPNQHIERVYWTASKSAYRGIVEAVASRLVQLVAEIRALAPANVAATPAEIEKVFSVAVHSGQAQQHHDPRGCRRRSGDDWITARTGTNRAQAGALAGRRRDSWRHCRRRSYSRRHRARVALATKSARYAYIGSGASCYSMGRRRTRTRSSPMTTTAPASRSASN